jgi:hypothetical protein
LVELQAESPREQFRALMTLLLVSEKTSRPSDKLLPRKMASDPEAWTPDPSKFILMLEAGGAAAELLPGRPLPATVVTELSHPLEKDALVKFVASLRLRKLTEWLGEFIRKRPPLSRATALGVTVPRGASSAGWGERVAPGTEEEPLPARVNTKLPFHTRSLLLPVSQTKRAPLAESQASLIGELRPAMRDGASL